MASKTITRTIERGIRSRDPNSSYDQNSDIVPQIRQQLDSFVKHSEVEKKDLNKLNDRMATYVDRVKALEGENFKLLKDIQDISSKWGDNTRDVKNQFENDLYELRRRVDDTANFKAIADVRLKRAQYDTLSYQQKHDDLIKLKELDNNKVHNLEREFDQTSEKLNSLLKSIENEQADIEKYRNQRDNLCENMTELLDNLDDELLKRITTEYTNQTLREHIIFTKEIHEKEVLEMSHLTNALPFNDQIEFYKDQLKKVITNIRKDYEQLSNDQNKEMQEWMRLKTEEIVSKYNVRDPTADIQRDTAIESCNTLRSTLHDGINEMDDLKKENDLLQKRLHAINGYIDQERDRVNDTLEKQGNEIQKLNENIGALLDDYNHLNSNKATLEYEIQVYKRLLDSQLNRMSKLPVSEVKDSGQSTVSTGAFGGKVQNKKEKKGHIGIDDASPDGKYIVFENSGINATLVDLGGWKVYRQVDTNPEIIYTIPNGTRLSPNQSFRIWGSSYYKNREHNDIVNPDSENWNIGINSTTRLLNPALEEKSRFIQQITFSN